jgi:threonine dehydrogenase-like Zn-dependent dehydrogenase
MNERELRALIRGIAAERLNEHRHVSAGPPLAPVVQIGPGASSHPSHDMYLTVVNLGDSCVIEPAVPCTHCNYCKSHGY